MEPKKYKLVNITKKKQTQKYRGQTSGYQLREGRGGGASRRKETERYKVWGN